MPLATGLTTSDPQAGRRQLSLWKSEEIDRDPVLPRRSHVLVEQFLRLEMRASIGRGRHMVGTPRQKDFAVLQLTHEGPVVGALVSKRTKGHSKASLESKNR